MPKSTRTRPRCSTVLGWTFLAAVLASGVPAPAVWAAPGDTTWVHTFDEDFINWATPHEQTFTFPLAGTHSGRVLLYYTLGCPPSPGDCDPWDRLGYVRLRHATETDTSYYEIARIVTPYDITPPPRPVTCTWEIDVSDYEHLLHGEVTLNSYIESWIGGNRGWLVTMDFAFIEGEPAYFPYKVENLWTSYYAVYGDPDRPIESVFSPRTVQVDAGADAAKVRVFTTGHGQGNTLNCAEFCNRIHYLQAGPHVFSHNLWRSDCPQNPCSPQGGTWTYPRAGWCPGSDAPPWELDVTPYVTAGAPIELDYSVQAYENFCRPSNPDCVNGSTCPDCNYNYTGHTEPIYALNAHIIYYRINPASDVAGQGPAGTRPSLLDLDGNSPNPFRPPTWIRFSIEEPCLVSIAVLDAGGRVVRQMHRSQKTAGAYSLQWDGKDDSGNDVASGVYFYQVQAGRESSSRRMLLLR